MAYFNHLDPDTDLPCRELKDKDNKKCISHIVNLVPMFEDPICKRIGYYPDKCLFCHYTEVNKTICSTRVNTGKWCDTHNAKEAADILIGKSNDEQCPLCPRGRLSTKTYCPHCQGRIDDWEAEKVSHKANGTIPAYYNNEVYARVTAKILADPLLTEANRATLTAAETIIKSSELFP